MLPSQLWMHAVGVYKHDLAHQHSGVTGGGAQETLPLIAEPLAADRLTEQGNHCLQLGTL